MKYHIGKGTSTHVSQCVDEASAGMQHPKLIIFFSTVRNFKEYAEEIHKRFPDSISMGATSIAAFLKTGCDFDKDHLAMLGIEEGISCSAGCLYHIDQYPIQYLSHVKESLDEIKEKENTICLEFTTALLCAEEAVLSTLNAVLKERKIPIFGGSAGDQGRAENTMVALNGNVVEKGTVFALIHNEHGKIKVFRENIYTPITGNILTATKVDRYKRTVYEYNHQPAATVFAHELGVPENQLYKYLDTNPIGRIIGDELYITANCEFRPDHAIVYHARIFDNAKILVLKPDDYKEIIQTTKQKIRQEIPNPSLSIMCHCLARSLLFQQEHYMDDYLKSMSDVLGNFIGFGGYGEQYGSQHFNQTMTVAVWE